MSDHEGVTLADIDHAVTATVTLGVTIARPPNPGSA